MVATIEIKYWVAFSRIPQVGRVRFKMMKDHFCTLEQAWHAGMTELLAAGLDARTARHISTRKLQIDPDQEYGDLLDYGARAITWHDDEYPALLKEIHDLPPVLYLLGELRPEDERSVAVVGALASRRATAARRHTTSAMASQCPE